MKILMINKFLYPNGGSETYVLKLGEYLQNEGHEVQYFGMEHEGRCVGNQVNAYTTDMDFHGGSKLSKLLYPIKTIYSLEARKKIRLVLDDFKPDVCHLNNFNYQLTPSIILEIVKWRKQTGRSCRIVYTAHDYQLICPNHMLYNPNTCKNCEKCIKGQFYNCAKNKCIHGSFFKSLVGCFEAYYWNLRKIYKYIDVVICPSDFVKKILSKRETFKLKTTTIHNFIDKVECANKDILNYSCKIKLPDKYVLYFGRYSEEKGLRTLFQACRNLKDIIFVFAGDGPLKYEVSDLSNAVDVGFQRGDELKTIIKNAMFCICPSEWYEIYGLTNAEAIEIGTPVVAAKIGGISEVVDDGSTGKLFDPGNVVELSEIINNLYHSPNELEMLRSGCLCKKNIKYVDEYYKKLYEIYAGSVVQRTLC